MHTMQHGAVPYNIVPYFAMYAMQQGAMPYNVTRGCARVVCVCVCVSVCVCVCVCVLGVEQANINLHGCIILNGQH